VNHKRPVLTEPPLIGRSRRTFPQAPPRCPDGRPCSDEEKNHRLDCHPAGRAGAGGPCARGRLVTERRAGRNFDRFPRRSCTASSGNAGTDRRTVGASSWSSGRDRPLPQCGGSRGKVSGSGHGRSRPRGSSGALLVTRCLGVVRFDAQLASTSVSVDPIASTPGQRSVAGEPPLP
jgi:hypothetical protein